MQLHFHGPRAYEFLRKRGFKLPHPRTLNKSVDCNPDLSQLNTFLRCYIKFHFRWTEPVDVETGFSEIIFNRIRQKKKILRNMHSVQL